MISTTAPRYHVPRETWDAKKCAKLAKATQRDGLGTPYSFKGYVGNIIQKSVDYNGGTVINGEWYQGIVCELPVIPEGFAFVNVPTWGLRIINVQ